MNLSLLQSKKFRAAVMAAISATLAFVVSEFGLKLDVDKMITLITTVSIPFLIYIGAEGYSERDAKAATIEGQNKSATADQVLAKILADLKEGEKNEK